MNILRRINSLNIGNIVKANYIRWTNVFKKDIKDNVQIMFIDGLIGLKDSNVAIQCYDKSDYYGIIVDQGEDLIKKYSLKNGDILLGRDENYILFRDGNITIKTQNLNLNASNINVTLSGSLNINGVPLTFTSGKMLVNSKEVAVVGGDISTITNKITTSGQ